MSEPSTKFGRVGSAVAPESTAGEVLGPEGTQDRPCGEADADATAEKTGEACDGGGLHKAENVEEDKTPEVHDDDEDEDDREADVRNSLASSTPLQGIGGIKARPCRDVNDWAEGARA